MNLAIHLTSSFFLLTLGVTSIAWGANAATRLFGCCAAVVGLLEALAIYGVF